MHDGSRLRPITANKREEDAVRKIAILCFFVSFAALMLTVAPGYSFDLNAILGRGQQQNLDTFKLIHVADLKAMMGEAKTAPGIYDANGAGTRAKFGVIPGAKLLDSDGNYDLSVLPHSKDAKIVFYCANIH